MSCSSENFLIFEDSSSKFLINRFLIKQKACIYDYQLNFDVNYESRRDRERRQ